MNSSLVYALSLLIVSIGVCATEDSIAVESIMRPGMILRGLIYYLNPLADGDNQVLSAEEAEVANPSNILLIKNLRFKLGRKIADFSLDSQAAVYDMRSRTLTTKSGFRANGSGLLIKGSELRGELKSRVFQIGGHFEVQVGELIETASLPKQRAASVKSPAFPHFICQTCEPAFAETITPLGLVQDFAGDLVTFINCWDRVGNDAPNKMTPQPPVFTLVGHKGGEIDFERMQMRFTGKSAILGPGSILVSTNGIHLRMETLDGDKLMHVTGQGKILAWIHPPQATETWISSTNFEYLSDGRILQFEGGPLMVARQGMILKASESWQFVRVFDGGRIVLSPGSWNVAGSIPTSLQ